MIPKPKIHALEAERITDFTLANHCVNECWNEISEDNAPTYIADVIREYWIGLYSDQLIGCYRIHQINAATHEIHAFILPNHRDEYAKESGLTILQWILDNTDCQKLICNIPEKYQNVIGFVKSLGFKHEGINRLSFTKNGKLWNMHNFGLTRNEIKELV